jgi:hypothetical protein
VRHNQSLFFNGLLGKQLQRAGVKYQECSFEMVAVGPIWPEQVSGERVAPLACHAAEVLAGVHRRSEPVSISSGRSWPTDAAKGALESPFGKAVKPMKLWSYQSLRLDTVTASSSVKEPRCRNNNFPAGKVLPIACHGAGGRPFLFLQDFDEIVAAEADLKESADRFAILHKIADGVLTLRDNGCYRQSPYIFVFRDDRGVHEHAG